MARIVIIGNRFLVDDLKSSGHDVRYVPVSHSNGVSDDNVELLDACDCCVLETSPIGYGYFEAGWVAGRGKPVFMIPTSGDVLSSFRALGVTSVPSLVMLRSLLDDIGQRK
jgi:nucleoside 2-deoxyribosyltransferase